jgi:heme/copper-type cytochrome/quinol oxidase subunit 1
MARRRNPLAYSLVMRRGEWATRVRSDPKGAMEADLIIAVVGVLIIVMGGLVTVAGVHRKWSTDNAGNPVLGNIVAAVGALVILLGVALAIANVVIWITGRRRGARGDDESPS